MKQESNIRERQAKLVKERDESIRRLYNEGLSMDDIVMIMKHGKHTVHKAIHANDTKVDDTNITNGKKESKKGNADGRQKER